MEPISVIDVRDTETVLSLIDHPIRKYTQF